MSLRCDNYEVDVRPGQTQLCSMRSIHFDLAVRYSPLYYGGDVFNQLLLKWLHLCEYVLDSVSELQYLNVELVIHIILVLYHLFLGARLKSLYHANQAIVL